MASQTEYAFDQARKPAPVRPELLLSRSNTEPKEKIPAERLVTAGGRSILFRGEGIKDFAYKQSPLVRGSWEIESGAAFVRGLTGQKGTIGRTIAAARDSGTRVRKIAAGAASHIPPWLSRGYHPIIAPQRRLVSRRRTQKGFVYDHNDSHIFNGESRATMYPSPYPECCICRIDVYTSSTPGGTLVNQKYGTGFMVGSRIMMTSGHMRPPEPYADWMIAVTPGSYDGNSVFGAGFMTYASDYWAYDSDPGDDFMLCRLYDPIGDTTGYFGAISYNDDWEDMNVWTMTGYPFDFGSQRRTFENGIAVVDDDDGDDIELPDGNDWDTTQIETKADTASGASGSPIYSWFDNGEMYAIGANKGWEEDWEVGGSDLHEVASGGDGFVEFIRWGRANWP